MKIFGIGLSKTGTTSLTRALQILGFSAIHYPNDNGTLVQILDGTFSFDCLRQYDAATDTPIVRYYAQLDKLYSGSKFILTTRKLDPWLRSCERHWRTVSYSLDALDFRTIIDLSVYGCARFNAERFKFVHEQHLREVRCYFHTRHEDLLELDITNGDGWSPLCTFLKRPVPEVAFPWLRKRRHSEAEMNM
jgi:hypothetical protein